MDYNLISKHKNWIPFTDSCWLQTLLEQQAFIQRDQLPGAEIERELEGGSRAGPVSSAALGAPGRCEAVMGLTGQAESHRPGRLRRLHGLGAGVGVEEQPPWPLAASPGGIAHAFCCRQSRSAASRESRCTS